MRCLLVHQDMQRKARAELDAVVGSDRLPTLDDRKSLPYLEAFLLEVMRLFAVAPLGENIHTFST